MKKNKRIGILTFSYSANVGSVLQTYALQKTISDIDGFEADIIHYSKNYYYKPVVGENIFTKKIKDWTPKNIVGWIVKIYAYHSKMKRYKKFFKKYYNGFRSRSYSRKDLSSLNDMYDKFIVGSDQIWNCSNKQVDDTYFLDFVKDSSKKISYAASFGKSNVPEENRESLKKLLSDFSSISVREPRGVAIVSDLISKKPSLVLDPSLLLDKDEYKKMSLPPNKKGYVLIYLRAPSKKLDKIAKELADTKGLEIVKISRNWLCGKGGKRQSILTPEEWLGYVQNASYVLTNSFHGICFSIVFEKQFFIDFLNQNSDSTNSRLQGMIEQFGLTKRCVDDVKEINSHEEINYAEVSKYKEIKKKESLLYIKNSLKGSCSV